MITHEEAQILARTLADEIALTIEQRTAELVEDLVRRPGAQSHRAVMLGRETGWRDLVWRAVESADLVSEDYAQERKG